MRYRAAHCYVNVKVRGKIDLLLVWKKIRLVVGAVGTRGKVGNSEWNGVEWRVFHFSTVSTALAPLH